MKRNSIPRDDVFRLTKQNLDVRQIASEIGCSEQSIYKIQYGLGLREPGQVMSTRHNPRVRRHRKSSDPDAVAGDVYRGRAAMLAGVCVQHPDRKAVTTDGGIPLCAECDADTRLPGGANEYCEWHGRQSVAKDVEEMRR